MAEHNRPPEVEADNAYGLHADVAADFEEEEGPPLGAHTGQNRTVIPDHAKGLHQGPKTTRANRDIASRRG
jgi:hypothetical protein